ncbi:hypothetical protein [Streptomyces sp. NPDC003480]
MGDFFDWVDYLFGGSGETGSPGTGTPTAGGLSGAWSIALGQYSSQLPGPLGQVVSSYLTSGINFDDPSELVEAMSMLNAASAEQQLADSPAPAQSDRLRLGELEQVVAYGETASDAPNSGVKETVGLIDQAAGLDEANNGSQFGGSAPALDGARTLESLDRADSPRSSEADRATVDRNLVGIPAGQPATGQESDLFARPENAVPERPETNSLQEIQLSLEDPLAPPLKPGQVYGPPRPPGGVAEVQVRGSRPPEQGDGIQEVHVWGVRPPRSPQTPPARPENDPKTRDDEGRGFWSRGGLGLALGVASGAAGVLIILSNPVGWMVGITGALMLASGAAATLTSGVELGNSYAGNTTAEQEATTNRAVSAVLGTGSLGGIAGGLAGTVIYGDDTGLEQGQFLGGLVEGMDSLGRGLIDMSVREARFGWNRNMNWKNSALRRNQRVFDLGGPANRQRPNPLFYRGIERIDLSHALKQRPGNLPPNAFESRLQRFLGPRRYERLVNRPFNLQPMWATEHALIDEERYQTMITAFKLAYPQPLTGVARWARLTPQWALQSGYGAGLIAGDYLLPVQRESTSGVESDSDMNNDTNDADTSPPPDEP